MMAVWRWFGTFHEERKHFPKSPLLSTYERRLSPPSLEQHTKEKSTTLEHHSKGLGPS
jgi:hypothetical protein